MLQKIRSSPPANDHEAKHAVAASVLLVLERLSEDNGVESSDERLNVLTELHSLASDPTRTDVFYALSSKDVFSKLVYILHILGSQCDGQVGQVAGQILVIATRIPSAASIARTAGAVPPLAAAIRSRRPWVHQACDTLTTIASAGHLNAKVLEHAEVPQHTVQLANECRATSLGVSALLLVTTVSKMSESPLTTLHRTGAAQETALTLVLLLHDRNTELANVAAQCLSEVISIGFRVYSESSRSKESADDGCGLLRSIVRQLLRFEAFAFLSTSQGRCRAAEPLTKLIDFLESNVDELSACSIDFPLASNTEGHELTAFLQRCALARSSHRIAQCLGSSSEDMRFWADQVFDNLEHHVLDNRCQSFVRTLAVVRAAGALLDLALQWRPALENSDSNVTSEVIPDGQRQSTILYRQRVEQRLDELPTPDEASTSEWQQQIAAFADELECNVPILIRVLWAVDCVSGERMDCYFELLVYMYSKVQEAVGREHLRHLLRETISEALWAPKSSYTTNQAHASSMLLQ